MVSPARKGKDTGFTHALILRSQFSPIVNDMKSKLERKKFGGVAVNNTMIHVRCLSNSNDRISYNKRKSMRGSIMLSFSHNEYCEISS